MTGSQPRSVAPPLVLIVDHDDDTRSMYTEYLIHEGSYLADDASDGRDAFAKAIARRPAAIVTETRLPGMDGLELCASLRRDPVARSIPIIVVTADSGSLERARKAGADAVLIKPCMPDALLAEIIRVIGTSSRPAEEPVERGGGDGRVEFTWRTPGRRDYGRSR